MAQLELLNNVKHKDLKIITEKKAEFGDAVNGSLVFPGEFVEVQKEYPIYFQKDAESGEFQAFVLFGFEKEQNLYLNNGEWEAYYIPALMNKEPFYIGFQNASNNPQEKIPVVHVDVDSPKVSWGEEGEAVFLEDGSSSPFLEKVNRNLMLIHQGLAAGKTMFDALLKFDLIEQFTLDIIFNDGDQFKTGSYYTIHQKNLYALNGAALMELHKSGCLQCAHMVLQSMSNIKRLIDKKNVLNLIKAESLRVK